MVLSCLLLWESSNLREFLKTLQWCYPVEKFLFLLILKRVLRNSELRNFEDENSKFIKPKNSSLTFRNFEEFFRNFEELKIRWESLRVSVPCQTCFRIWDSIRNRLDLRKNQADRCEIWNFEDNIERFYSYSCTVLWNLYPLLMLLICKETIG